MGINSPNYELNSIRILHVDDEEFFLEASNTLLKKDYLHKFNIDMITFRSVKPALELLKREDVDVIISDYQMPDVDGLEFLSILREANNNTPFIILTGRGREEVVIKALNLGADYYIQKGLDINLLFTELSHYISVLFDKKREKSRRKIVEQELQYRVNYEEIISALSTNFINLTYNEIDKAIFSSLNEIMKYDEYDSACIIQLEDKDLIVSFGLPKNEFDRGIIKNTIKEDSYINNLIKDYFSVHIIHIDKINEDARKELIDIGFEKYPSLLSLPLSDDENSIGMVIFGSKEKNRHWGENNILFLRMVGEMISKALLKKKFEKEFFSSNSEKNRYVRNLEIQNENLMEYILEFNRLVKEYLQKNEIFATQSLRETVDLNNIVDTLQKNYPGILIEHNELPVVLGVHEPIRLIFKLFLDNAMSFKQSSTVKIISTQTKSINELEISSDSFSVFYDIPNALYDISSVKQYYNLFMFKRLLEINKWELSIKEGPVMAFKIKNILSHKN
ncbi:MAG: Response regulator SaeR [Candidatus Heimdallarchaeota archaeon LC_3]|nr:MAG: Response regulator SaeR [Candidatus Heimdallarchaeota archaeon LC_3]